MKSFMVRCAFAGAMTVAVLGAWAQGGSAATIEFSSGDDIVVIRGGKRLPFKDPIGLELVQGDQVQTGKGVFVEMRLGAGGSVLKLAENTTFVLERLADGQTSLQLVYGRMRAKVEKLAGTESFTVRSPQAVAGVRGTDFGMDVVATRSTSAGATTTKAYCFQGSVEVVAFVRTGAQAAESLEAIPRSFLIEAGEMVRVEVDAATAEAVKVPVDESIRSFWSSNDYVTEGGSALAVPAPGPAAAPAVNAAADERAVFDRGFAQGYDAARLEFQKGPDWVPEGFVRAEEAEKIRAASRLQSSGVAAGSLIGIGAAASSVYGLYLIETGNTDGGISALRAGAIMGATAIPFFVLSMFAKP